MTWMVVRVRGTADVDRKIADTLVSLNLTRPNHGVLLPETDDVQGMLHVVKDYVTWGEVDADALELLLSERGRLPGDAPLTDDAVAETSEYGSVREVAEALAADKTTFKEALPGAKRVLRLHPPRKGWSSTKRPYRTGGALGYRASDITELVERMV